MLYVPTADVIICELRLTQNRKTFMVNGHEQRAAAAATSTATFRVYLYY